MGRNRGSESDRESQDALMLSRDTILAPVRQIEKCMSRSWKTRFKLLNKINEYLDELSQILSKNDSLRSNLLNSVNELLSLIIGVTTLSVSLSNPPSSICEVYDVIYNMGSYLENLVIRIYLRCRETNVLFGEVMKPLMNSLIKISCENPTSWLYSVLISPIVLHMLNVLSFPDHEEFRTSWCYEVGDYMFQIAHSIFECGDFACQYYLVTILSSWARWTIPSRAIPIINSAFPYVHADSRKELLRTGADAKESARMFLNSFNLSIRGPKNIIPIRCMYLFVCGKEIRPPDHQIQTTPEFWVDFSIVSGRVHAFYCTPTTPLASLSIRRDQIDSICLNWVVNDGQSQSPPPDTQDGDISPTFMKDEKVLFFHIVLNVDFEAVNNEIQSFAGKQYRSIYFVFRDGRLVEKVMQDMGYNIHMCGTKNCERPRALRKLLATKHKLSYTESWCPESQVFGLDKTMNETAASARLDESMKAQLRNMSLNRTTSRISIDDIMDERFESEEQVQNKSLNGSVISNGVNENIDDLYEAEDQVQNKSLNGSVISNGVSENMDVFELEDQVQNKSLNGSVISNGVSENMDVFELEDQVQNKSLNGSVISNGVSESMDVFELEDQVQNKSLNGSVISNGVNENMDVFELEDQVQNKSLNASVISNGVHENMDVSEQKDQDSLKENRKPSQPVEKSFTLLQNETSTSATFVTVSEEDHPELHRSISSKGCENTLDLSTATNYEDPLPPTAREKYAHLYKHAPFHQTKKITNANILCSTPKIPGSIKEPAVNISCISPIFACSNASAQEIAIDKTVETGKNVSPAQTRTRHKETLHVSRQLRSSRSSVDESEPGEPGYSMSPVMDFSNAPHIASSPQQSVFNKTLEIRKTPSPVKTKTRHKETPHVSRQLRSSRSSVDESEPGEPGYSMSPVMDFSNAPHIASSPQQSVFNKTLEIRKTPSPVKTKTRRKVTPHVTRQLRSSPSSVNESEPGDPGCSMSPVMDFSKASHCAPSPKQNGFNKTLEIEKTPPPLNAKTTRKGTPNKTQQVRCSQASVVESECIMSPLIDFSMIRGKSSSQIRSKPRESIRTACYTDSYAEWTNEENVKKNQDGYDPYDYWNSAEMEKFKNELFGPEIKTYADRKKRKRLTDSLKPLKRKIIKMKKSKTPVRGKKTGDEELNSELFAFMEKPRPKYASFFKTRK